MYVRYVSNEDAYSYVSTIYVQDAYSYAVSLRWTLGEGVMILA